MRIDPNGVNAIPSLVTGWLDARGDDDTAVKVMVADFARAVAAVGGTFVEESWTDRTPFDADLTTRLSEALDRAPYLPTGAGHDAGILANAGVPTAMLFVRNPSGVSHSPAEYAEPDDCLAGVRELARVVEGLLG